jgi:MoxR-like ATPase
MNENATTFQDYTNGEALLALHHQLNDAENYFVQPELRIAIKVALLLGQPLLVTGEPGTGKTQLAGRIAYELKLSESIFPLIFNTTSISVSRDLFYQYDALRHFHDVHIRGSENTRAEPYITYEALGQAMLLTLPPNHSQRTKINQYLPRELQSEGPLRPVVLIDEIDKAPRDLPNDVLNEIEQMTFTVKEIQDEDNHPGMTFKADPIYKPIVIITSNSEKDLPDAFLRRCVFYHIDFPDEKVLNKIVKARLNLTGLSEDSQSRFILLFTKIRGLNLKKRPATAELLYWMRILESSNLEFVRHNQSRLSETYYVLAKTPEDLRVISEATDKLIDDVLRETVSSPPIQSTRARA